MAACSAVRRFFLPSPVPPAVREALALSPPVPLSPAEPTLRRSLAVWATSAAWMEIWGYLFLRSSCAAFSKQQAHVSRHALKAPISSLITRPVGFRRSLLCECTKLSWMKAVRTVVTGSGDPCCSWLHRSILPFLWVSRFSLPLPSYPRHSLG